MLRCYANEPEDNEDPTTRRTPKGILAMEEAHADDLVSLLEELGGKVRGRWKRLQRDRQHASRPSRGTM
jgi:hypothetical protein